MSAEINTAAATWAARVDRGELLPEQQRDLDAWLAADRRHLGAFARARAVSAHFDRASALGADFDPARLRPSLLQRVSRHRLVWIAAVAATLASVAILGMLARSVNEIATHRGEVRLVPLADGSVMTLNTSSRVSIAYTEQQRRVRLLEGEALFNVAKDSARPFVVEAGSTRIQAVGTSFTVRHLPGEDVKVVVREGVVQVEHADAPLIVPIRIPSNNRAIARSHDAVQTAAVTPAEVERDLAWREGMISLDGVALREAVAEFGRYSDTRIIIEDPTLAEKTVTGLFSANNPVGFARAVASSMDLKATVEDGAVRLHR